MLSRNSGPVLCDSPELVLEFPLFLGYLEVERGVVGWFLC